MELAQFETEEKLAWDEYELPVRNRQRLIQEHERKEAAEREAKAREKAAEEAQREEGCVSLLSKLR